MGVCKAGSYCMSDKCLLLNQSNWEGKKITLIRFKYSFFPFCWRLIVLFFVFCFLQPVDPGDFELKQMSKLNE